MSQIKRGAILSYLMVAFNIISGFFFTPYLIRKVGKSSYGIYMLVVTFLNYFLIDFGLGKSIVKYISLYRAQNDTEKINKFIAVAFKIFAFMALFMGTILFVLYFFLDIIFDGLSVDEMEILKKMYVISGISAVLLFLFIPLDDVLNAYECFTQQKTCELLRKIFIIILSVIVLSINNSIVWVSVANAVSGIVIVFIKLIYVQKYTSIKPMWRFFDIRMVKAVTGFSIWLALIMIEQRLIIPLAPTILGKFSNSIEISVMAIVITIEGYVYTIAASLNGLFLPKLTKLVVENKNKEINNLFILVGRIQVIIIGLILSVFVVFGKEFINAWVGKEFENAYWPILLLITPTLVTYAQEIANSMLMIEHYKLRYKVACYGLGAFISTFVGCILAPKYGALGTSIGIALCTWISHVIIMNVVYDKLTILDIKSFFKEGYLKAVPMMLVLIVAGIIINSHLHINGIVFLVIKIILFSSFFLILTWTLIMKEDEKKLIIGKMKGLKKIFHKTNFY